jgi:hypothetical protein
VVCAGSPATSCDLVAPYQANDDANQRTGARNGKHVLKLNCDVVWLHIIRQAGTLLALKISVGNVAGVLARQALVAAIRLGHDKSDGTKNNKNERFQIRLTVCSSFVAFDLKVCQRLEDLQSCGRCRYSRMLSRTQASFKWKNSFCFHMNMVDGVQAPLGISIATRVNFPLLKLDP